MIETIWYSPEMNEFLITRKSDTKYIFKNEFGKFHKRLLLLKYKTFKTNRMYDFYLIGEL